MRNFLAALYFVLALFGCESGGTTTVTRAVLDGADVLHARTRVKAGVARFECLASASGQCHYLLFRTACDPSDTKCKEAPIDRFAMKPGETREVVGLPEFEPCVLQNEATIPSGCHTGPGAR